MINYLIINKLGTVIYQSVENKKSDSDPGSVNDSQRIRFLPLLVIKDLIKANLNSALQYVRIGNKVVVFKEQHNLLYIACSKKRRIPINLLQLHLRVMHNFIRFHYGPHWSLNVQGNSRSKATISPSEIRTCLSQLPFLSSQGRLSIRSCDNLCCSEQVQVSEDLRFRLTENMTQCCNSTFIHQYQQGSNSPLSNYHQHRGSFFSTRHKSDQHEAMANNALSTWAYCFLFAREKIVAQCCNHGKKTDELPDEFVYFLKLLVSHYLQEKHDSGNTIRTTTLPQNISSNSTSTTTTTTTTIGTTTTTTTVHNNQNVSPASSSSNYATTTNSSIYPSSLAYVYDASSTSAPFKIKEKSASSVTVVSSDSSISYWSNPLSHNLTHHVVTSPPRPPNDSRTPSNVLIPNRNTKQQSISDILNGDGDFHYLDSNHDATTSFLSSSVPSESITNSKKSTFNAFNPFTKNNTSSAPSSPTHNRSRSQSFSSNTTNTNEDYTIKNILANLINGESSYLDQTEDVKLIRRWVKLDGHSYLANFIIIILSNGLCSVIVCKDDPEKAQHKFSSKTSSLPWKPSSHQVKQFKVELKSCLADFATFLLTKESTHFTNLSFATSYPGMIHFFHLNKGVMISPLLVDLNELDKNHELLHEVYGRYYNHNLIEQCKWKWPSELKLRKLCNQLLELGMSFRIDQTKHKSLTESKDREYYFLYQRESDIHQELLAIYFGVVPPDRLWNMHQKLFNDISQRVLLSTNSL